MESRRNDVLAKKLSIVAYVISAVILLLVGLMRRYKIPTDIDFSMLPSINAGANTIVAICLVSALVFVKKKNIDAHKTSIYGAMLFSFIFLLSYVLYHFTTPETLYCGDGIMRTIYFIFLVSHIVLAAVSLPFILMTFIRGYTFQIDKHKKLAKWVWPIWFYVAVSGPICYLMLRPCYG